MGIIAYNVINKNSKAMKADTIIKIGEYLKNNYIDEDTAQSALLILFGVSQQSELVKYSIECMECFDTLHSEGNACPKCNAENLTCGKW